MTETNQSDSRFSASASFLGYIYQSRLALYHSLIKLRDNIDFSVSIETLDDIVFENNDNPRELLQTKHSVRNIGNLSNASSDLWKTIRIWVEGIINNRFSEDTLFILITTSNFSENSIAYYLSNIEEYRNVDEAIKLLDQTSITSTNIDNQDLYTEYNKLSNVQKNNLFNCVFIFNNAKNIFDLDEELSKIIHYAVENNKVKSFLDRLEGWWFRKTVNSFRNQDNRNITSFEIREKISEIREQFKRDNLPIDDAVLNQVFNPSSFENELFVKQLNIIDVSERRKFFAIRDHLRAYTQRSKWISEDLLIVGEIEKYELQLFEEWSYQFERFKDDLPDEANEAEKKKAAKKLYSWIESDANFPIRTNCIARFITTGSYHILSNQLKVGWHPEYYEKLRSDNVIE